MQIQARHHQHQLVKCTFVDHLVVRMPVSVVFFYRKAISSELFVESLRTILSDFPIFAGTIIFQDHQLFIDCKNQGVCLKIVHLPGCLLDHFPKTRYFDPINPKSKNGPVLTIKLNYFSDGMAIGYTWNHALGDMATFMELLKALSACAKGEAYPSPLILKNRDDLVGEKKECANQKLKQMDLIDTFLLLKEVITPKKNTYIYFSAGEVDNLRNRLSQDLGTKVSRNTAICSHLFETLLRSGAGRKSATIAVNFRSHVKAVPNSLGNFVDSAKIDLDDALSLESIAGSIHDAVTHFQPDCFDLTSLIESVGGTKNIHRIFPKFLLPQAKNLLTSNWTNFGASSIDFGIEAPFLFLPMGKSPLPWAMNIIEGIRNQGLLLTLCLPPSATRRLLDPVHLKHLHRFRYGSEPALPEELKRVFV